MSFKLLLICLFVLFIIRTLSLLSLISLLFYSVTMFILLPIIYYMQKVNAKADETKEFLRIENVILTPSVRKKGYYKTISRVTSGVKEPEFEHPMEYSMSPYPSKRVEEVMDEIIDEVLKYYVLPYAEANNWKFKRTENFIRQFLKGLISRVVHRMSIIEWNDFICTITVNNIQSHLHFLKSRTFQLAPKCNYFLGTETENLVAEALSNRLLRNYMDKKFIQCEIIYRFCLGLLAHQVLKRTIDHLGNPANQNQWLFHFLMQRRMVQKSKSLHHPGHTSHNTGSVVSGSPHSFQYNMSYEDFFRLIESIQEVDELRKIRQKLQKELRNVDILREGQQVADSKKTKKTKSVVPTGPIKRLTQSSTGGLGVAGGFRTQFTSQRHLKTYRNQLRVLKETVEARLRVRKASIGGGGTNGSGISNTDKAESQSLSKRIRQAAAIKNLLGVGRPNARTHSSLSTNSTSTALSECIPYETVMDSNEGRKFFKDFLNSTVQSRAVELVELLNHFQQHPDDRYVIAQGIMKRYIHSSPPAFEFEKTIIKEMEEFLRGNASEDVFISAKEIVDKELRYQWYPFFIISPFYSKFAKFLAKEFRSMALENMCNPSSDAENSEVDILTSSDEDNEDVDDEEGLEDEDESEIVLEAVNLDDTNEPVIDNEDNSKNEILVDFPSMLSADIEANVASEEEEEEDGFLKPRFEDGCFDDMEFMTKKLINVSRRIEEKEKARMGLVKVVSKMPLSRSEKLRMNGDLNVVESDLNNLRQRRSTLQYRLGMMDRWRVGLGKWSARVYDIILPEPKRGSSVDLGKVEDPNFTNKGDGIDEEDCTRQVLIVLMLGMGGPSGEDVGEEELGWLVRHSLKDFQTLRRQLSHLSPSLEKVSLPKVPQRLFLRRKYTENDLSRIKNSLNQFLRVIMSDEKVIECQALMNFFCLPLPEDGEVLSPHASIENNSAFHQLASTITGAGAKVMRLPTKFVQRVLLPNKVSSSNDGPADENTGVYSNIFGLGSSNAAGGGSANPERKRGSLVRKNSQSGSFKRRSTKDQPNAGVAGTSIINSNSNSGKDISTATFELLEELIQLRKNMTLTRRSMMVVAQSVFGRNLSQILIEKTVEFRSESSVFSCLQKYRDSYRVGNDSLNGLSISTSVDPYLWSLNNTNITGSSSNNVPTSMRVNTNSSPTLSRARGLVVDQTVVASCENLHITATGESQINFNCCGNQQTHVNQQSDTNYQNQYHWPYSVPADEAVKRLIWDSVSESWRTLLGTVNVGDLVGFVFESCQSLPANKALLYRELQSLIDEILADEDENNI